jgi:hypothetical protein
MLKRSTKPGFSRWIYNKPMQRPDSYTLDKSGHLEKWNLTNCLKSHRKQQSLMMTSDLTHQLIQAMEHADEDDSANGENIIPSILSIQIPPLP